MKISIRSSIGTKLIGGFLIVVAMSVLIGAVSYIQFYESEMLVSVEVMEKAEARHLIAQIIQKSTNILSSVNEYLLAEKESRKEALRSIIHDNILTLREFLSQLKKREPGTSEEETIVMINRLFLTRYIDLTMKVLKDYDSGETSGKEKKTAIDEFRDVHSRFVTVLQNLNTIETDTMYHSWELVQEKIRRIKFLIFGLSAVALILGVFLGILSTRFITKPVYSLVNTLEKFGSGDFEVRSDIDRKDEIGFLAEKFNLMLEQIKMHAKELSEINQELIQRNEELNQSRKQLQMLTDTIPDAVCICTLDGKIINVNQTFISMFEYNYQEALSLGIDQLCRGDFFGNDIRGGFAKSFSRTNSGYECMCRKKDGEIFPAGLRLRRMQIGEESFALSIITDFTERKKAKVEKKRLEDQLMHAQKMEAVGTLAGGVAHDFNNVLQAIGGYVELLMMRKDTDDPDYNYLSQVEQLSQRAGELVKQLLIFSRKVESRLRPVDINQEVANVHKLLTKTIPKMISIQLDLTDDIKIINGDTIQLEQIIMNLAVNARDAMPEGGTLSIRTENITVDEISSYSSHPGVLPGEYVLLSVADSGHGIEKEIQKHIFDPFFTLKPPGKGTGLGLATVYGIVKSHGGYVICKSEPDMGTCFKVYFPALDSGAGKLEPLEKSDLDVKGGCETIMLVDDEKGILNIGSDILKMYGYNILTAGSGEMALELFKEQRGKIDLVVLDVGMPGMGGLKCFDELVKIDPDIKVIIASGYALEGNLKNKVETGPSDFISKPYQLPELLKKIRDVLDF
ncbi:MAG: response regulator [Deltaproteobacteria bacterium]|nr:response regulator [Deltaproteobacteria bacterium]